MEDHAECKINFYTDVILWEKKMMQQSIEKVKMDLGELLDWVEKHDPRYPMLHRELDVFGGLCVQFHACMNSVKNTLQPPDWTNHSSEREKFEESQ